MNSTTGRISGNISGSPIVLPHQTVLRPPCFPDVLAWHKGRVDITGLLMVDSATAVGPYPLEISKSHCVTFDGVDDGTTATDHGTIASSSGTSILSYDGSTLSGTAGTLFDVTFSDGTHFRMAEGDGVTSYDDTGSYTIAWDSLDYDAMWAGRQDSYHGNLQLGWWEKTADDTKYPYPVSGFIAHHKGNTWNNSESTFAYKEEGVGLFDGIGDKIYLGSSVYSGDFTASFTVVPGILKYQVPLELLGSKGILFQFRNNGDIWLRLNNLSAWETHVIVGAYTVLDTQKFRVTIVGTQLDLYRNNVNILSTVIVNPTSGSLDCTIGVKASEYFQGIISNVDINGLLIPLDDAQRYDDDTITDIHDSDGNIVGTLTSADVPLFWSETEVPCAIQQSDAPYNIFTDASGGAVARTQEELLAHVDMNTNDQDFMDISGRNRGLTKYNSILTGECLMEAKDFHGL